MVKKNNKTQGIKFRSCVCSSRLKRIDPEAAVITDNLISQALLCQAKKGAIKNLLLMIHELANGKIPAEVRGEIRTDCHLDNTALMEIFTGMEKATNDEDKLLLRRLLPLLRSQLGIAEVVQ
jgi:hypothetical protein